MGDSSSLTRPSRRSGPRHAVAVSCSTVRGTRPRPDHILAGKAATVGTAIRRKATHRKLPPGNASPLTPQRTTYWLPTGQETLARPVWAATRRSCPAIHRHRPREDCSLISNGALDACRSKVIADRLADGTCTLTRNNNATITAATSEPSQPTADTSQNRTPLKTWSRGHVLVPASFPDYARAGFIDA
jgi:hypothetical protein